MGQTPSQPKPGARMQVVGAGLSRTGTSSLSLALSILLDGPVYHGGTQILSSEPAEIKSWISILSRLVSWGASGRTGATAPSEAEHGRLLADIHARFDGFVAATDSPACNIVPEVLQLYPGIKVVVTVRDPDAWFRSVSFLGEKVLGKILPVLLLPLPTMRHLPAYLEPVKTLYDVPGEHDLGRRTWEQHIEHVKRVVPAEQLLFFDVKEGWGPLCTFLGVDVPKGLDFPRLNDGAAIDDFAARVFKRALLAWAGIGAAVAVGVVGFWTMWKVGSGS